MISAVYCPVASNALPKLFLKLPEDECKAPRDGLRLDKTEDMLFLATLLKRAGTVRYFVKLDDGAIIPEPVEDDESECSNPVRVKSRIKRTTVLRSFRNGFFPFRQEVASGMYSDDGDRYMIRELRNIGRWKRAEPSTLAKELKWPFQKGPDQLLSNLCTVPLLSWPETRLLKKGEVYCPLDGPVAPIKMLSGGCIRRFLCPDCLGQFQNNLLMIP